MEEKEVRRVVKLTGFQVEKVPFTYLGVPISPRILSMAEGRVLTEKMVNRIRQWSSRNMSYAGRITLINSVLMMIQVYWCQIIILPQKVLKEINQICRAFLWKGSYEFKGPGALAWEAVCEPKRCGGLGFKKLEVWNKAACLKYIWAVSQKQDNLWVKWIHHVYL